MKTEKEIGNLTWKYFIRQKVYEIIMFLTIVCLFIFVPYYLGFYVGDNIDVLCNESWNSKEEVGCGVLLIWFEGLCYILFGGLTIFLIYKLLSLWIKSNWKKAKKQARREVYEK